MADPRRDFEHLTVAERIQLVEDLWDSIADAQEVLELTEAQRAELDRRLEAHRETPDEAIPWETLRRELLLSPPPGSDRLARAPRLSRRQRARAECPAPKQCPHWR